ncbi:plasmid mobilization relaxosome protein MobC [Brachybacterium tyrofermentans]|uniref:plasmid mobilization relaxosome protein MobC n=1 Tax=Brachybacterium tyrofermentans TaxID=47848 RepID=UPI003FCF1896
MLKVTDQELALLESLAGAQGVSKQAVLMRAVLTGGSDAAARYERLREDLSVTRLMLANVANNVNQLAHQANSFAVTGGTPVDAEDVERALRDVRAVLTRVDAVATGSGVDDAR